MNNLEKIRNFIDELPHDNINLCKINPHDGRIKGISLQKDDERLYKFIEKYIGNSNLYYTLNEIDINFAPDNKPSKIDIDKIRGVHVDIDLEKNIVNTDEAIQDLIEQFDEVFDEMRRSLYYPDNELYGDITPSYIVDTGGGIQAVWLLDKPLTNTIENREKTEGLGKILENIFQSDHTHNIDRLLRLPYTNNFPSKKKLEYGREQRETKNIYNYWPQSLSCHRLKLRDIDHLSEILSDKYGIKKDSKTSNKVLNHSLEEIESPTKTRDKMKKILRKDYYIVDLLFGLEEPPNDNSRSTVDFIIAGRLNKYGFSFSEICFLMSKFNSCNSRNAEIDERYVSRCIERYNNE